MGWNTWRFFLQQENEVIETSAVSETFVWLT
jgi:hypothetical protein